jgi:hypothetical protein
MAFMSVVFAAVNVPVTVRFATVVLDKTELPETVMLLLIAADPFT